MFCFTSNAGIALVVAMLCVDGALPLPDAAGIPPEAVTVESTSALPQNAPYLEIHSQGYSRFEIMGDEVVAHMSGGVDFSYMGYAGHADELVYHHGTQQAEALGDVRFILGDLQLSSDSAVLDISEGKADLGKPVYGKLEESGMILEAQVAHVTFPAGQPPSGVEEVQAELTGGVSVFNITGSWMTTSAVRLNGGDRVIETAGPFALVLSSKQLERLQIETDVSWGSSRITGSKATVHYDEKGMISMAEVTTLRIANDVGSLAAENGIVTRKGSVDRQEWGISLTGCPVTGHFADNEKVIELRCETLGGTIKQDGEITAVITGEVFISTEEQQLSGERFVFEYSQDGKWYLSATNGLDLGFELAEETLPIGGIPFLGVE